MQNKLVLCFEVVSLKNIHKSLVQQSKPSLISIKLLMFTRMYFCGRWVKVRNRPLNSVLPRYSSVSNVEFDTWRMDVHYVDIISKILRYTTIAMPPGKGACYYGCDVTVVQMMYVQINKQHSIVMRYVYLFF